MSLQEIESNLLKLREEIKAFEGANLLAVSKSKTTEEILKAYECGQRDFGENKVQELLDKSQALSQFCPHIKWHFIGSLQTNKINSLLKVDNLVSIHSIDSIKLLNKCLSKIIGRRIGLFLQLNTSGEKEKSGFDSENDIFDALDLTERHPSYFIQGLMTIGKIRTEEFEKDARVCFETLLKLQKKIKTHYKIDLELSMGMSSDYKIALEMQSNWIRIGSGIFGTREK